MWYRAMTRGSFWTKSCQILLARKLVMVIMQLQGDNVHRMMKSEFIMIRETKIYEAGI